MLSIRCQNILNMEHKQDNTLREKFDKILLIICDQFRFPQHWEPIMSKERATYPQISAEHFPNYARLRGNGLEFRNCYIASAACNASRACIYTGKYGKETGVTSTSGFGNEAAFPKLPPVGPNEAAWFGFHPDDPECSLPPDEIIKTLGTHFQEHGFRTPYRGKWHLSEAEGHWPNKPYAVDGLKRFGFEGWAPPEGHGNTALRMGMGADISYVQDAVNTLYELKDTNYKWFMPVNLINPHDVGFYYRWPLQIPDFDIELPSNHETMRELIEHNKPLAQLVGKWYWNHVTFDHFAPPPKEWKEYVNFYAYLAQIADFNMGILLDTIEATGQLDDTLIVFLSDHGEMGGSHGLTQKWYQAYEETIHVPLIFSNPKLRTKGQVTSSMASLIDIAPTLLSMAGIPLPAEKVENENGFLMDNRDFLRGEDLSEIILKNPAISVQDAILFVTDDDSVGSVLEPFIDAALENIDDSTSEEEVKAALRERITENVKQRIPNGSKWQGERPSESKFREEMREKFLDTDFGVKIKEILAAPRFVRAIVTNDGWKLVRYVMHAQKALENADNVVYEMYNLNVDRNEMVNLATAEHLSEDNNSNKFEELKDRLDDLLDEKYYHESLRCECSEKVQAKPKPI